MMIEMHHWLGAEKEAQLFRILSDLGYRFEYLDRYAMGRHLAVIAPSRWPGPLNGKKGGGTIHNNNDQDGGHIG
jgi:hypothetical protein